MTFKFKFMSRLSIDYPENMMADPVYGFEFDSSHVISRDDLGEPLSLFGDDIWDLAPYRPPNSAKYQKINFGLVAEPYIDEAKFIIGAVIYGMRYNKVTRIRPTTIISYSRAIKKVSEFSAKKGIKISDVLSNTAILAAFLRGDLSRRLITDLIGVHRSLSRIDEQFLGFSGLTEEQSKILLQAKLAREPYNQVPIIPQRLMSNLIIELDSFFLFVGENEDKIHTLLNKVLRDPMYGRHTTVQRRHGVINSSELRPNFSEALIHNDLECLLTKYSISSSKKFSKFISSIQHAVQIYICIFSGMRRSEIQGLKQDSLEVKPDTGTILLNGIATKNNHIDNPKAPVSTTAWVTTKDVIHPYSIANRLAKRICQESNYARQGNLLFPSTVYLNLAPSIDLNRNTSGRHPSSRNVFEVYELLNQNKFQISSEDHKVLETLDPFRSWTTDRKFEIEKPWRFTYHQFRRSLAYYISQSGLVSLQSLQRQLKHVTTEMTVYYCQSWGDRGRPDFYHNEFHEYLFKTKPAADAVAYIANVVLTDEVLSGAADIREGLFENHSTKVSESDRKELERLFKLGQISYSETPLGACLTRRKCSKRSMLQLTGCIGCESGLVKLSKLDKVISSQAQLIKNISRNSTDDFIYRTEMLEFQGLEKLRERILEERK